MPSPCGDDRPNLLAKVRHFGTVVACVVAITEAVNSAAGDNIVVSEGANCSQLVDNIVGSEGANRSQLVDIPIVAEGANRSQLEGHFVVSEGQQRSGSEGTEHSRCSSIRETPRLPAERGLWSSSVRCGAQPGIRDASPLP